MKYDIISAPSYSLLEMSLNEGESVIVEPGSMAWMDTTVKNYGEENTGVSNLVNSLDMVTWWALMTFFYCDEKPIVNALL